MQFSYASMTSIRSDRPMVRLNTNLTLGTSCPDHGSAKPSAMISLEEALPTVLKYFLMHKFFDALSIVYFGAYSCFFDASIYEPSRGKTNNVVSDQVRHKLVCAVTEAD